VFVLLPVLRVLSVAVWGELADGFPGSPAVLPQNPLKVVLGLAQLIAGPLRALLPLEIQPAARHVGPGVVKREVENHHDQQGLDSVVGLISERPSRVHQGLKAHRSAPRYMARVPLKSRVQNPEEWRLGWVIGRKPNLHSQVAFPRPLFPLSLLRRLQRNLRTRGGT